MKKTYYDASTLESVVSHFEETYGLSSAEFVERVAAGDLPDGIPGFHRHTWLSFYRDIRRLRGADFADNAARVLAVG
jgi:hypothetical protein